MKGIGGTLFLKTSLENILREAYRKFYVKKLLPVSKNSYGELKLNHASERRSSFT